MRLCPSKCVCLVPEVNVKTQNNTENKTELQWEPYKMYDKFDFSGSNCKKRSVKSTHHYRLPMYDFRDHRRSGPWAPSQAIDIWHQCIWLQDLNSNSLASDILGVATSHHIDGQSQNPEDSGPTKVSPFNHPAKQTSVRCLAPVPSDNDIPLVRHEDLAPGQSHRSVTPRQP